MNAIHHEVSDDVRATILSMQALMHTLVMALSVPVLGIIADNAGLPSVYLAIALGLSVYTLFLFGRSRTSFPRTAVQPAEVRPTTE
jgi:hypothetical protein